MGYHTSLPIPIKDVTKADEIDKRVGEGGYSGKDGGYPYSPQNVENSPQIA